jgi:hypothetical protein
MATMFSGGIGISILSKFRFRLIIGLVILLENCGCYLCFCSCLGTSMEGGRGFATYFIFKNAAMSVLLKSADLEMFVETAFPQLVRLQSSL